MDLGLDSKFMPWPEVEGAEAGLDCSAAVLHAWMDATEFPIEDMTSAQMFSTLETIETTEIKAGDAIFYGPGEVTHVVMALRDYHAGRPLPVIGANRGRRPILGMDFWAYDAWMKAAGAMVRVEDDYRYRADFMGCARMPL